jgi:Fe-S-cluster containining protein
MFMVIAKDGRHIKPMMRNYLDVRCRKSGKYWIVNSPCPFLIQKGDKYLCGVEDNKPELCRAYKGYINVKGYEAWIPEGCTMVP